MDDFVTVERADNEAMAQMIKQRLEDAEIPCFIASTNLGGVAGAGAAYTIAVAPENVDAARELLGAAP